ncbi:unnamed protein product, partial [Strongylus vulgaris]
MRRHEDRWCARPEGWQRRRSRHDALGLHQRRRRRRRRRSRRHPHICRCPDLS